MHMTTIRAMVTEGELEEGGVEQQPAEEGGPEQSLAADLQKDESGQPVEEEGAELQRRSRAVEKGGAEQRTYLGRRRVVAAGSKQLGPPDHGLAGAWRGTSPGSGRLGVEGAAQGVGIRRVAGRWRQGRGRRAPTPMAAAGTLLLILPCCSRWRQFFPPVRSCLRALPPRENQSTLPLARLRAASLASAPLPRRLSAAFSRLGAAAA